MSVSKTVDRLGDLLSSLEGLVRSDVLVGVPQVEAPREGDEELGPINNAALAYIHDNGSPAANIPARPFIAPGVAASADYIAERFKAASRAALDGNQERVGVELEKAGLQTQANVRAAINAGPPPPLADSTLTARRARGREGTVPLVDTGQLRNSINYVVRHKG